MEKELNAEDIINFVRLDGWHGNYDIGVTEFCPYQENRRIDAFFFSRWNRETKGYEIKVNRNDFLQDKKWQEYLKFCTWFSFITPKGVIKKEELPDKIGLIEISVKEKDDNWQEKIIDEENFYRLEKTIVKKPRRLRDKIEEKNYIKLLEGLLIKLAYNKNIIKTEY